MVEWLLHQSQLVEYLPYFFARSVNWMNVCVLKKVQEYCISISTQENKNEESLKFKRSVFVLLLPWIDTPCVISAFHFEHKLDSLGRDLFKQVSPLRKFTLRCCLRVTQGLAEISRLLDLLLVIICSKAEKMWLLPFWRNWHIEIFFQQIEENWN